MPNIDFIHVALPHMREEFRKACRAHGWSTAAALRDHQKMAALALNPSLLDAYRVAMRRATEDIVNETADEMGIPRLVSEEEHAMRTRAAEAMHQEFLRKVAERFRPIRIRGNA